MQTNASFYDAREQKWTLTTDINVGALTNWMRGSGGGASLNTYASSTEGHQLNSIYVDDKRTSSGKLTAVRVSNGQTLPPSGLTVATDLPIYVKGHFNAPDTTVGSTNTANDLPASLVGDAITVLSGNWSDAYGNNSLSARTPVNTTVNAAFLAGIVQPTNTTGTLHYSGGVENFPRFLENWSGVSFTYNGSMVVMYPSQFATNYWVQTGTYYNAPNRKWAFDVNFLDYRRLPPATPVVRKLVRGEWNVVAAQLRHSAPVQSGTSPCHDAPPTRHFQCPRRLPTAATPLPHRILSVAPLIRDQRCYGETTARIRRGNGEEPEGLRRAHQAKTCLHVALSLIWP